MDQNKQSEKSEMHLALARAFEASLGPVLAQSPSTVAVALSGGLDSTVLTHALMLWLRSNYPQIGLWVITINHRLRSDEEMLAETIKVIGNCLAWQLPLSLVTLPPASVATLAKQKSLGIEAAARELRYKAFDAEISRLGIAALVLGHHQDDDLEGQVMGFFRGQELGHAMASRRGRYLRPFLSFTRNELLEYARAQGLTWHEDSSNLEASYLRNRVRHELLPGIERLFPGYRTALATLRRQGALDSELLESLAAGFSWTLPPESGAVLGEREAFSRLHPAIRWRSVRQACLLLLKMGLIERLPGKDLYERFPDAGLALKDDWLVEREGVQFGWRGDLVFLRPRIVVCRKKGYLHVMTEPGVYQLGGLGTVAIHPVLPGTQGFSLPVSIRSLRHGDISPDDGRSIWQNLRKQGVPALVLADVPVLVTRACVRAVLGANVFGRDIWFSNCDSLGCDETGSGLHRVEIMDLELPT